MRVMNAAAETGLQAFIVTSEPPRLAGSERVIKRWAVLSTSAEAASELVRMRVAPECVVSATDEALTSEEVSAIGLQPGHAKAM